MKVKALNPDGGYRLLSYFVVVDKLLAAASQKRFILLYNSYKLWNWELIIVGVVTHFFYRKK